MDQKQLERFKELDKTQWYQPVDFGDVKTTKIIHPNEELLGLERWNFIKQHIDVKGKRIIDLGCANGLYTIQAVKDGAIYGLGLDSSSMMIEKAIFTKEVFNVNCEFKVSDITKDDLLKHGQFNIAFCFRILYHLNEEKVNKVLNQLNQMVDIIVVQGCHVGKQYMCSQEDIVSTLHHHGFINTTIHNINTNSGNQYHYFLVVGRKI